MKKLKFALGRTLSNEELKKIKGAEDAGQSTFTGAATGDCWITTYGQNGAKIERIYKPNATSSAANDACVTLIITAGTGVYRCTYTCDYPSGGNS